jgi:hypothetical protein
MAGVLYFPKSPKFLYINTGRRQDAIDSIHFYHGPDADVDALLKSYEEEKLLSVSDIVQTTVLAI